MNVNYIKHYSQHLGRDMEYKTYGESGRSVLVFPSQDGRFFDFENFDMVATLAPLIEDGKIRLICCDGIDWETWSCTNGIPRWRIVQHEKWYNYICEELIPRVRRGDETFVVTGCSMGAFHAGTFFFRRPDIFDTLMAFSGCYTAREFFGDYMDDLVYQNSVEDFLPNIPWDHYYMDLYRQRNIICVVGQGRWEDMLLESTRRLDTILAQRGIPHWFDYWGYDSDHDWPWWRNQIWYHMNKLIYG